MDGLTRLATAEKAPCLVKITIPSWAVAQIKRSLDTCGIDETTVFPNLEALSRVVEFRWKDQIKYAPHHEVLTRLRPSKIHGVGVFAIKDIRKGKKLFSHDLDELPWIKKDTLKRLPAELGRFYDDFAIFKDGRYGCPSNFNRLTMSWYLNESKNPNVRCDKSYNFWTLRNVKAGEELTVDYLSYP